MCLLMCMMMHMRTSTHELRTNIVLDADLVDEATRLTGIGTRRALVHEAFAGPGRNQAAADTGRAARKGEAGARI